VATPRSTIALLSGGAGGHDPYRCSRGSHQSGGLLSQGLRHGSRPIVGRIIRLSRRALSGWCSLYWSSPSGSVVLFVQRGTRMASDRAEVTSLRGQCSVLVLVRAGVLGRARPLPVPSRGRDGGEVVHPSSVVRLRKEEGVVVDPGLSVRPGLLGSARLQSFGPLLAGVLQAAWPAI
jgi:hypothetical protein